MNFMRNFVFLFFLFSHGFLHSDKDPSDSSHFSKTTTYHENGDSTVTYEHYGTRDSIDYYAAATFEHSKFDTLERTSLSNVSCGYSRSDRHDTTPEVQIYHKEPQVPERNDHPAVQEQSHHEVTQQQFHDVKNQSNSGSSSSWNNADRQEHLRDHACDLAAERQEQRQNNSNQSYDIHNRNDYSQSAKYDQQRSTLYLACKGAKESIFGKSKKTLRKERQQQEKINLEKRAHACQQQQLAAEKKELEQKRSQLNNELERAYAEHQQSCQSSKNQEFQAVMQARNQPFADSLKSKKTTSQQFELKNSTIGFMQAYDIDHHQFQELHGFVIEHQLTQELIKNLNFIADIADQNFGNQQLMPLIQSGALVSGIAQNYNQQHKLLDAIGATNCSHGFTNFLQGMTLQAYDRCEKFMTALSFFNCELAQYSLAAARGIATGILSSEIASLAMTGLYNGASYLAPQLTASVYAGATSIITPIALTAGALCGLAMLGELGKLGYFYSTNQIEKINIEYQRMQDFAGQFYNFDQAPVAHVENLATLATTLVWPWQGRAIFESLMGFEKVQLQIHVKSGVIAQQVRTVSQNQLHDAFAFMKNTEFINFRIEYRKILGEHVFAIFPDKNPGLVVAGMNRVLNSGEQKILSQIILKTEGSTVGNVVKSVGGQIVSGENAEVSKFVATEVGCKMELAAKKDYEKVIFIRIAKEYNKLLENQASQEVIDSFCKCHELSIVPEKISTEIQQLHEIFKDKYLGLPEYDAVSGYLTMQMRHIFYPTLQPELDRNYQSIKQFTLHGFHHDEYEALEKSGLFKFVSKIYGDKAFGAEECFIGKTDWGSRIICNETKTFFPANWSKEKIAQVIFEAAQNRIKEIEMPQKNQRKFQCQGPDNMLIDIVFNSKNVITSAYPSTDNFIGV